MEGPIAVTECTDESADPCDYERRCGVRANWQRINEAVQSALAEITLAEMAMSSPPPLVALARDRAEAAERRASATEPGVTEPSVTEPSVTEPSTTQPSTTQPGVTQPGVTEPHPVQESA
ncbi:MAG TPA: Rrf2 family transcriptional regulator [Polyangiaceae bacterium LLY-WYZ-15_(1-7)]|nr:Rrf2 family transcriptional regulator [Polyangiaceae bacterium LLY-WYZ-15_(1-7)]